MFSALPRVFPCEVLTVSCVLVAVLFELLVMNLYMCLEKDKIENDRKLSPTLCIFLRLIKDIQKDVVDLRLHVKAVSIFHLGLIGQQNLCEFHGFVRL